MLRERKERRMVMYDEAKKEIGEMVDRSKISITLELPEEFEALKNEFLALETDDDFKRELQKLVKKRFSGQ